MSLENKYQTDREILVVLVEQVRTLCTTMHNLTNKVVELEKNAVSNMKDIMDKLETRTDTRVRDCRECKDGIYNEIEKKYDHLENKIDEKTDKKNFKTLIAVLVTGIFALISYLSVFHYQYYQIMHKVEILSYQLSKLIG